MNRYIRIQKIYGLEKNNNGFKSSDSHPLSTRNLRVIKNRQVYIYA